MTIDCCDLVATSRFWRDALRYREQGEPAPDATFHALFAPEGAGGLHHVTLQRVPEPKSVKNRAHLDLFVDDLDSEVDRLVALGASIVSEAVEFDDGFRSVVMGDPEGHELCVVERRHGVSAE